MPKSWKAKVTAIEKAKDLSKLCIKEMIGSLITHELQIMDVLEDNDRKKKLIAFKLIISLGSKDSDQNSNKEEDGDLVLISKKFKKILSGRKKKSF